jgi:hypothetical protein
MKLNQNKLNVATLSVLASLLVVFSGEAIADPQSAPFEVPPAAFENVNLDGLRSSLRETDAIGFTTKLSLKHNLDSLLDSFGDYHDGRGDQTLLSLRERFSKLLASTLSSLREADPQLFTKLRNARGDLWLIVSDPMRFKAAVSQKNKEQVAVWRQD